MSEFKISPTGYWESDNKISHTRCEPLCNWIIQYLGHQKDKQTYDFGCGNGHYLQKLHSAGFTKLTGIEGNIPKQKDFENIVQQDLTMPFNMPNQGNCIFLEVAEHIPQNFEDVLLDNVINACDDKLIMSWAIRGQGGDGHINEIDNEEAIEKITSKGMVYLPEDTTSARQTITANEYCWWFRNTTLIFKRA